MKVTVWIVSSLLALAFVVTGCSKLFASAADLHRAAQGVPLPLLRIAGAAELLGGIGLVVPAATRIAPVLTPLAAAGLVVTMVAATGTNIAIGAPGSAVATVVLGLIAAFVARARLGSQQIPARPTRTPSQPARSTVAAS